MRARLLVTSLFSLARVWVEKKRARRLYCSKIESCIGESLTADMHSAGINRRWDCEESTQVWNSCADVVIKH